MIPGVVVRLAGPEERGLITSTWMQSLRPWRETLRVRGTKLGDAQGWALVKHLVNAVLYPKYAGHILVAVSPGDVEVAHGWMVVDGARIVWAYVKPKYRGMGVLRQMRAHEPAAAWSGFDPFLELESKHGKADHAGAHEDVPEVCG